MNIKSHVIVLTRQNNNGTTEILNGFDMTLNINNDVQKYRDIYTMPSFSNSINK